MSRRNPQFKVASVLFGFLLIAAVLFLIYLRQSNNGSLLPAARSYNNEEDLSRAQEELDSADLDSPTEDERALESDLNF